VLALKKSQLMDEEGIKQVNDLPWLGSLLGVPFQDLTLLVGGMNGFPPVPKPAPSQFHDRIAVKLQNLLCIFLP